MAPQKLDLRTKKIASCVFNPFINDSRVLKEAHSLATHGYKVLVVAHRYKDLKEDENILNFKVKRFVTFDREISKSKIKKLIIYLKYLYKSVKSVKDFDIIHANDLNTLPIAFIIKKFYNKNAKIVYDAHEYETEVNGLSGIQKTLSKYLEKFLIKYADKVICVSDAIASEYVKLYHISKPALVLNTPAYKKVDKKDIFRETLKIPKEKTIFLYQGGLSSGRGIEILLEAFKTIQNSNAVVVFMGYGELEPTIQEAQRKNSNIYFHKAVLPEILLDYTSSADFGISTIEDSCLSYRYCLPNKMFEYAMANVPVIVSNLPEMKKVVQEKNIGIVAEENTPKGLQEAIQKALMLDEQQLQVNIEKVKEIYNWENQEKVLLELYGEL